MSSTPPTVERAFWRSHQLLGEARDEAIRFARRLDELAVIAPPERIDAATKAAALAVADWTDGMRALGRARADATARAKAAAAEATAAPLTAGNLAALSSALEADVIDATEDDARRQEALNAELVAALQAIVAQLQSMQEHA